MRKKDVMVVAAFSLLAVLSYWFFDFAGPLSWGNAADLMMEWVSVIGEYYVFGVAALLVLLYALVIKDEGLRRQGLFFLLAMLVNATIMLLLKTVTVRERPVPSTHFTTAFPSAHTGRAALAAKMWGDWHPRVRVALYGFVALVAFSRLYLGAHYLSDIFAGFAISYAIGAVFLWLFDKYMVRK